MPAFSLTSLTAIALLLPGPTELPPGCSETCFAWTRERPDPGPGTDELLAYDSERNVTILLSGSTFDENADWTWERDGTAWRLVTCLGPHKRHGRKIVYDSWRGTAVLFGGTDSGSVPNDLWEWDGIAWTQRIIDGPKPDQVTTMTFDSERGVIVLVEADGFEGKTWELDGDRWILRQTGGIGPRDAQSMAFDTARSRSVLLARTDTSEWLYDTWEWNGSSWMKAASDISGLPDYRFGPRLVYNSTQQVITLFGMSGCDTPILYTSNCLTPWTWDGFEWAMGPRTGPFLYSFSAVFDSQRSRTIMFGGFTKGEGVATTSLAMGTLEFDGSQFMVADSGGPTPRRNHAMSYDNKRGVTVLFGGDAEGGAALPRTWEWNGDQWTALDAGGPWQRSGHAMTFDAKREVTVVVGGQDDWTSYPSDTWEWDGVQWVRRLVSGSPQGNRHATSYDSARGVVVLVEGEGAGTWEYDGDSWIHRTSEGPFVTNGLAATTYDPVRQVTVLFNGETWEWNGDYWRRRSTEGPPVGYHRMNLIYDESRETVILFKVEDDPFSEEDELNIWEWNGRAWSMITRSGPSRVQDFTVVYDHLREVAVLFDGGYYGSAYGTWEFRFDESTDGDIDGVLDECDRCPATRRNDDADESGCVRADSDFDGDVDLRDVSAFLNCSTHDLVSSECGRFNIDSNGSISAFDLREVYDTLSGP